MTFSLTVLGNSAAIPAHNRNLSAHLLNANERFFLIDCGEGTQFQLRRYKLSFQRIRHILISHLHGDHFFGLIGLLNSMHLLGRKEPLTLYGPSRLREIITLQLEVSETMLNYPVHFIPLQEGSCTLILDEERISVHSFPLNHRVPTWGFVFREKNPPRKISRARSYAYCSDTAYAPEIVPWIKDVGVIYHEATFMESMKQAAADKFHATAMQAAMIAAKAEAGKLLLGHFSARYDDLTPLLLEARSVFKESYLAGEGIAIPL